MHLQLRDQQLKTILYIQRLLYQNFMVAENQKPTIDRHTNEKKQSKYNSKGNNQTIRKGKKGRIKTNKEIPLWLSSNKFDQNP